jgi:hypothetical protein
MAGDGGQRCRHRDVRRPVLASATRRGKLRFPYTATRREGGSRPRRRVDLSRSHEATPTGQPQFYGINTGNICATRTADLATAAWRDPTDRAACASVAGPMRVEACSRYASRRRSTQSIPHRRTGLLGQVASRSAAVRRSFRPRDSGIGRTLATRGPRVDVGSRGAGGNHTRDRRRPSVARIRRRAGHHARRWIAACRRRPADDAASPRFAGLVRPGPCEPCY